MLRLLNTGCEVKGNERKGLHMDEKPLTAKQASFCFAYTNVADKTTFNNGVESARYAGYKGNDATLNAVASENLRKPMIAAEIGRIRAEEQARTDVTREEIVKELRKLSGLDTGATKLNNNERIRALEILAKHKAMLTDVHQAGNDLTLNFTTTERKPKQGGTIKLHKDTA